MGKQEYEDHPFSSVLPLMGQRELNELAADVQGRGLLAPITLFEGKILDGRNRYRACLMVGVEPRFRDFNGDGDPVDFIVSVNVRRRHLTDSQKGVVAAKIATLDRGRPANSSKTPTKAKEINRPRGPFSVTEAAKSVDTSPRTVKRAKRVMRDAPKEVKAVEAGEKTLGQVEKQIKKSKEVKTEKRLDKTDYPIPEGVLGDWDRAETKAREWLSKISQVRSELKSDFDDQDVILANVTNTTLADLNNAYTSLKCIQPYAVCASCQGVQRKKCGLCKGRGFLDHFAWKSYVPEETRKMREEKK